MLLAAGCGDDEPAGPGNGGPDPDPDPDPTEVRYLSGVVSGVSTNVLTAVVDVSATGADSMVVRVWRDGEAAEQDTPPVAFDSRGGASSAVLGLRADSDYRLEIRLSADGVMHAVDTLSFSTGSLPAWIPDAVPVGEGPEEGYVALSLPEGPVVLDHSGRVVWYLSAPDPVLTNFQAHPNGSFTLLGRDTEVQEFLVLNELGAETGRLRCVDRSETRFHEIRVEVSGRYWVMCHDRRTADLTALGGLPEVELDWTVVQRVSAAGELLWEWNSADHFDVSDIDPELVPGAAAINVTHGNAIAFDTDGSLLMSWRELNEVTKIDAETGEVIWRFGGGQANQFVFVDDPKGSFERQHGLRVVGPGVIQLLDNGDVAPSRLVRYRIDEEAMTATLIMEYVDGPSVFTPVGGGTDVLPSGGALVSFGRAGRVVEVTQTGARAWELTGIDNTYVFRSQWIPSLYAVERTN